MTGATSEPYYTDEDVIGSKYKYHRPKCPCIRNIEKTNRNLCRTGSMPWRWDWRRAECVIHSTCSRTNLRRRGRSASEPPGVRLNAWLPGSIMSASK